jgi:hypothetical protein
VNYGLHALAALAPGILDSGHPSPVEEVVETYLPRLKLDTYSTERLRDSAPRRPYKTPGLGWAGLIGMVGRTLMPSVV